MTFGFLPNNCPRFWAKPMIETRFSDTCPSCIHAQENTKTPIVTYGCDVADELEDEI